MDDPSKLFEHALTPETFEELVKGLLSMDSRYGRQYTWRGQADISWRIDSTAYRLVSSWEKTAQESDICRWEKDLLEDAKHKGFHFYEGREISDFELLARLRHAGAATRFIDTTRNPLVGLWFCCRDLEHVDKTGLLFGTPIMANTSPRGRLEPRKYDCAVKTLGEQSWTWEPTNITPRVAAQHSQFLYSAVNSDDKRGSLFFPDDVATFAISPPLKYQCLTKLAQVYDIYPETVFPDLDGFGDAKNQSYVLTNIRRGDPYYDKTVEGPSLACKFIEKNISW